MPSPSLPSALPPPRLSAASFASGPPLTSMIGINPPFARFQPPQPPLDSRSSPPSGVGTIKTAQVLGPRPFSPRSFGHLKTNSVAVPRTRPNRTNACRERLRIVPDGRIKTALALAPRPSSFSLSVPPRSPPSPSLSRRARTGLAFDCWFSSIVLRLHRAYLSLSSDLPHIRALVRRGLFRNCPGRTHHRLPVLARSLQSPAVGPLRAGGPLRVRRPMRYLALCAFGRPCADLSVAAIWFSGLRRRCLSLCVDIRIE
ncbi:hypothetical protein C8R47DRAFT_48077 [Mycena vitilis]|nr:hypothetical protein C8R47DRAFT_48077 [Mycena vitilis]